MTEEEAIALWKQRNPQPITVNENGEHRDITDEEYEEMAQDRATFLLEQHNREQAEATDRTEADAIKAKIDTLDAIATKHEDTTNPPTTAQTRAAIAELARTQARLLRYLGSHGVIGVAGDGP
jgi:hypothetical protein